MLSGSVSLELNPACGFLIGRIDSERASSSRSLAEVEHILLMNPKKARALDFFFTGSAVAASPSNSALFLALTSNKEGRTVDCSYCS